MHPGRVDVIARRGPGPAGDHGADRRRGGRRERARHPRRHRVVDRVGSAVAAVAASGRTTNERVPGAFGALGDVPPGKFVKFFTRNWALSDDERPALTLWALNSPAERVQVGVGERLRARCLARGLRSTLHGGLRAGAAHAGIDGGSPYDSWFLRPRHDLGHVGRGVVAQHPPRACEGSARATPLKRVDTRWHEHHGASQDPRSRRWVRRPVRSSTHSQEDALRRRRPSRSSTRDRT